MLTPAEELGLRGLGLAARVRKAFYRVPDPDVADLIGRLRDEALRLRLIYLRDGVPEPVRILPVPVTALPDQLAYVHAVSLVLLDALKRLPELYLHDPAVREALRLLPAEEEWLSGCWGPGLRDNNPVFARLDAVVDFVSPMWKDSLKFVEPNLSGVGGLHLVPGCEAAVTRHVVPLLRSFDTDLRLEAGPDVRELLMQELLDHFEALGRRPDSVCFVDPKYAASGPDEQDELARYYGARYGMRVLHADPAELTLRGDEVYCGGGPVGLVYRDYAVSDLIDLERQGVDVTPMRSLFCQNRVVSSIAAELDQKSCWEVFTDPELAEKYFTAEERQVFRRHVLWTRVVADRRTALPGGRPGDLLEFARAERERLVLKPNRAYGGQGVLLGPSATQAEWDAALDRALADPDRWVVQRLASIPVAEFPVFDEGGGAHVEPFHVVMGFAPTRYGLGVLGRASQKQVVNVAQRGGMCAVLIGRPADRLHGPNPPPPRGGPPDAG
jgi:hypothetical protein